MKFSNLAFAPYDKDMAADARELFVKYTHKDHQLKMMGACKERVANYLSETLSDPGCLSICMSEGDRLVGLISLQSLPWMSDHFGMQMYAVRHLLTASDGPLEHARLLRFVMEELSQVDFLDCRVAVDDIHSAHALELCGFRYVGTEMFFGIRTDQFRQGGLPEGVAVYPCSLEDRQEVLDIAGHSHVHNRFVYDPMINKTVAQSLYRKLVTKCFESRQFEVFVARSVNGIEGFITAKTNEPFSKHVGVKAGSLDFIGVRPRTRRSGIGVALNAHALNWLKNAGTEYAAVRTLASNYAAIRTLFRSGFAVTSCSLHFHKWIQKPKMNSLSAHASAKNLMRLDTAGTGSWIQNNRAAQATHKYQSSI